jgi:esterase/lipase
MLKNPKFFQDPQIDYPIYNLELPFQDYINKSRAIIRNTRQDLEHHAEWIIDCNSPFELQPRQPARCGILLIHGLLDSPFLMRDIGERLRSQGLLVRSIMLPGHGTVPGALLHTHYTEWLQAARYGVATLERDVDEIFLLGFSTGANLALWPSIDAHKKIKGIITLAPALKICSPFAFATDYHRAISWAWQRAAWFYIGNEIDYAKYCSVPFNAAYQVYKLAQKTREISPEKITCPLFFILSKQDEIVSSRISIDYFQRTKNPRNKMLIYSSNELQITDPRVTVRNSTCPDMNILNFSHISLSFMPNNPHYGMQGDYPFASRIEKDVRYGAFNKVNLFYYNALWRWKLTKLRYQRLTFNPDFDFFMQEIEKFIFSSMKKGHPETT